MRGVLDRLVGGPGLRCGRRDPEKLAFGDAVDFWRVTGLEPDRRLRLRAEGIRVAVERSAAGRDRLPRSRAG